MIEFEKLLKQQGRKTRVEVDMPSLPRTFEKELAGLYTQAIRTWAAAITESVVEAYGRELALRDDEVETEIQAIDRTMVQIIATFTRSWRDWATRAARNHYRTLARKLRYATNIELTSVMSAPDGTDATIEDLLKWNVELVRNITEEARQRIASAVYSGLTNRTPVAIVAKEIKEATGISTERAKRIASDQTVKLSSSLDAQRMKDLGVDGYIWAHSRKANPRLEHKDRDGKFIKFGSEIDKTDPPGAAPFCGCKRRMVLN